MKKFLSILLVLVFSLSLTACGEKQVETDNDSVVQEVEAGEDNSVGENTVEWKEFLNDYEEWAEDYITILKKYSENPTDMTILSDYTKMIEELTEWSEKADKITKELENSPEDAAEYAAELAKIAAKLAEVAN